jgi:hypothetical protein
MLIGEMGPLEVGTIVVAIVVIAGLAYWRIRLSRIPNKECEDLKNE